MHPKSTYVYDASKLFCLKIIFLRYLVHTHKYQIHSMFGYISIMCMTLILECLCFIAQYIMHLQLSAVVRLDLDVL